MFRTYSPLHRWHSMKPNKDELSLDITASAADLLTSLRSHLSFVDLYLSPSLTVDMFEALATRIDKLLLTEVWCTCMYVCMSDNRYVQSTPAFCYNYWDRFRLPFATCMYMYIETGLLEQVVEYVEVDTFHGFSDNLVYVYLRWC